jgi:8-oxo-dGTP pyrophosphatase MutT (NUDIX family)
MGIKTGAGLIPFARRGNGVEFLFHRTFSGRRAGLLVDFGGGSRPGEPQSDTALREFIEETEAMYLAADIGQVDRSERFVQAQLPLLRQSFARTQQAHPHWWCRRRPAPGKPPRDWKTFFVELEYRDPSAMNRAWAEDDGRRFAKRRELAWVPAPELLAIFRQTPERLWTRLRELDDPLPIIRAIVAFGAGGAR